MKLSVCIFTYNHEAYIGEAIESALAQETDFDYEIVIGEDCSTDSTRAIVSHYQEKYPQKIRPIFNKTNLGMMANNGNTIIQCRGEYIALLDGDDYWINNKKLQAQVDFLEANPAYALCFHDARILKMGGVRWDEETCCGASYPKVFRFEDVICDVHIPTCGLVFRRSALTDYPPRWFGELNAPDRPLFLMLSSNGPGYYINEPWGVYRKHPKGTWTGQHYQSQWLTHLQIYRVMDAYYNNKYARSFCRCEARVSYILAMKLIKDDKPKRALCYIRKYLRARKGSFPVRPAVYYRVLVFSVWYLKYKMSTILRGISFHRKTV